MVDVAGIEPATPCLQSDATKSILLVRLALFCVLVRGFGPSLAAIGTEKVGFLHSSCTVSTLLTQT
jgi:hypothetical protein